jgi:hypothetical protein
MGMDDDAIGRMFVPREGTLTNSRRRAALCVRIGLRRENRHRTGLAGWPVARTHADLSRSPLWFAYGNALWRPAAGPGPSTDSTSGLTCSTDRGASVINRR